MEVVFSLVGYISTLHPYPSWNFVISKTKRPHGHLSTQKNTMDHVKKKKFVIQSQETEN